MKAGNKYLIVIIGLAMLALFLFKNRLGPEHPAEERKDQQKERRDPAKPPSDNPNRPETFDRRVAKLIYTKHARCRMDCRHIDETEVKEILANGRVNLSKSDPASRPDPKFALEGRTRDGQEVRIIFAPASRGMVVITVIDLGREWVCDCN